MSADETLFIATAIMMLLFGLAWGLAGEALGLSRSASRRWMGFCLCGAGAAAVGALSAGLPPVAESGLRNVCVVLAFLLMQRGALGFLGLPLRQTEFRTLLVQLGLVVLVSLAEAAALLPASLRSAAVAALLCWLALSAGAACVKPMRQEFGWIAMGVVAGPMFGAGTLFAWRTVWACRLWLQQQALPASDGIGPGFLVALFTLATVFNLSLFYLVLTRLTRRLRHLASRDPLTNLLNRRTVLEALQAEHLRMQRGGEGCVVLTVDVDHFKRVNDTHGHAAGDEALRLIARVLEGSLRETDLAGRMGGEEFLLLLRMTDLAGAMNAAQRIRSALASQPVGGIGLPICLTVSIGLVVVDRDTVESVENWLHRADDALYRAKALGRDRVEIGSQAEAAAGRVVASFPETQDAEF